MRNQEFIGEAGEYDWSKDLSKFQCAALETAATMDDVEKCHDPRGESEAEQADFPGMIDLNFQKSLGKNLEILLRYQLIINKTGRRA